MARSQNLYQYYHGHELGSDGIAHRKGGPRGQHSQNYSPKYVHQPEWSQHKENSLEPPQSISQLFTPYTPSLPKGFDNVLGPNTISIVESHAEGEACDVVIGGFENIRGRSMYGRLLNFRREHDHRVKLLLNEPRGWNNKNAIFLLKPIDPDSERCLVMIKSDGYFPFSVSSIMCATNVLAELPHAGGPVPQLPFQRYIFETGAGKIMAEAKFTRTLEQRYRCDSVTVYCVPSFVLELGFEIRISGLGALKIDIAFGGVFCAFVDVESVGLKIKADYGEKLVQIGERIRHALAGCDLKVVHPKDHAIRGVSNIVFIENVEKDGVQKVGRSVTVLSPGRLDRSPSGTSTCAWLAVQHCRGQIGTETFRSYSLLGTRLFGRIRGELRVGRYNAIYTSIQGRAWVTGFKQVALDPTDPFTMGFRGADQWGPSIRKEEPQEQEDMFGLGISFDSMEMHARVTPNQDAQHPDWESANNALGETF
ncbi:hypothetical protein N7466_009272 [Penicillium verhagenii]|uniref:uncharacterized protein n=1 Tax=Penicillium verhagenii TaxID=1562060 RepID=UPI002545A0ED|nr:uncharacterized protein N7466_009272 [Penicillium verhagenii]KAJ5920946.1 hypothetical protein N7466_009272 [Penicillium verhagenii]